MPFVFSPQPCNGLRAWREGRNRRGKQSSTGDSAPGTRRASSASMRGEADAEGEDLTTRRGKARESPAFVPHGEVCAISCGFADLQAMCARNVTLLLEIAMIPYSPCIPAPDSGDHSLANLSVIHWFVQLTAHPLCQQTRSVTDSRRTLPASSM